LIGRIATNATIFVFLAFFVILLSVIYFLFFLAGILFVILCISLFMQLRLPIQYVPTPSGVVQAMVGHARLRPGQTVYDLGAGDGRVLIAAKRACPGIHAVAVEYVPTVYLVGRVFSWLRGAAIEWRWGNLQEQNLRDANVIFVYLCRDLMQQLEQKFTAELMSGTQVISHAFPLPHTQPSDVVDVWRGRKVYVYEWK